MKRLLTEWRENVYSTKYCCYRARTFISKIVLDFGPLCTKVYHCDENACEKMCAQKRIPFELAPFIARCCSFASLHFPWSIYSFVKMQSRKMFSIRAVPRENDCENERYSINERAARELPWSTHQLTLPLPSSSSVTAISNSTTHHHHNQQPRKKHCLNSRAC